MHQGLTELLSNAGISGDQSSESPAGYIGLGDSETNSSAVSGLSGSLEQASTQIQQLQDVTKQNADSVAANTQALSQEPESTGSSGGGIGSEVAQAAQGILGGSPLASLLGGSSSSSSSGGILGGLLGGIFGSIPLLSGIESLFGGGGSSQPPQLTAYQHPESQDFDEALSGGTTGDNVYGETGQPRSSSITELALSGLQNSPSSGPESTANYNSLSNSGSVSNSSPNSSSLQQGQSSQQVNVTVQAMDSQSFMDRASDIADAVRKAMLNMHPINDVVSSL